MLSKLVPIAKVAAPILIIGAMAGLFFTPPKQVGYAPEQPIPYDHKIHAGDYGIDCQYCHTGVTVGKRAGVPSGNICNNCHGFSPVGARIKSVQMLKKKYNAGETINWVKVHEMPNFVRFSHAPHIKALHKEGEPTKESCKTCHGDIANMPVVTQVESLNMGFCVNCHRDFRDDNHYKHKGVSVSCNTCHY